MTKEFFDKFVAQAKGCPFTIYGDNMMLFAANREGSYFIQDNDAVYCIRVNKTAGGEAGISQQEAPYEVVTFSYDEIQYLKLFPNVTTLVALFDGKDTVIEGETLDSIKQSILTSPLMQACSPRGVTGSNTSVNSYGAFRGSGVTMDKNADPYLQQVRQQFNETHKQ